MPLVPFENDVDLNVTSVSLELSQDNRVTVQDRRGRYRTNQFGRTVWQGTMTIGAAEGDEAARIETWLAQMDEPDNYCDIRLYRLDSVPVITSRVTGGTPTAWTMDSSLGTDIRETGGSGRYVRADNVGATGIHYLFIIRLYTESSANPPVRTLTLEPRENLPVGTVVRVTDTIRAIKRPGNTLSMPRSVDWSGPWQFNFKEYQG